MAPCSWFVSALPVSRAALNARLKASAVHRRPRRRVLRGRGSVYVVALWKIAAGVIVWCVMCGVRCACAHNSCSLCGFPVITGKQSHGIVYKYSITIPSLRHRALPMTAHAILATGARDP